MKLLKIVFLVIFLGTAYFNPVSAEEPLNYWGDDGSAIAFRLDTRFLRFYEFPVLVYAPETIDPAWSAALDEAIAQLAQVIEIERTYDPAEADITVTVTWGNDYLAQCPRGTVGCSSIKPLRNPDRTVSVVGTVTLLFDNPYKTYTMMHEMVHALGIAGHSDDTQDVMYATNQYAPAVLSERDKNTLRMLYASPGLQEDRPRG